MLCNIFALHLLLVKPVFKQLLIFSVFDGFLSKLVIFEKMCHIRWNKQSPLI